MDGRLAELATRQHGVVSLHQLLGLGLSRQAVARRASAGRLHRVHRGVYAVGHRRVTREGNWLAAVLTYGPGALLSHRSALALHGIRPDNRTLTEITVPLDSARSRRRIRAHGSRALEANDRSIVTGIPCTSLARTVLDSAPALGVRGTPTAVDQAEILRTFDLGDFGELLRRAHGHRGTSVLAAVLDGLREPDWTDNDYEAAVLALVRSSGLTEPICQAPMVLGGEPVRIDEELLRDRLGPVS